MNSLCRHILHYIISIYLIFGGVLSNLLSQNLHMKETTYLQIHFIVIIGVVIHWLTNNNRCFLSDKDYEDENGYTKHILSSINVKMTDEQAQKFSYGLMILVGYYSLYKLNKLEKNKFM